jgi:hypothetical protein
MVTLDELKVVFGEPMQMAPWGLCVVVPGDKFDPDWEAELGDQGVNCHFGDLDQHAVVFVPVSKANPRNGVVYSPPPAEPVSVTSKVVSEVKETKSSGFVEKKAYALRGPAWTPEDEGELLREYDRLVSEGQKYGAVKKLAEMSRFQNRSVSAVHQKIEKLLRKRRKSINGKAKSENMKKTEKSNTNNVSRPVNATSALDDIEPTEKTEQAIGPAEPGASKLAHDLELLQQSFDALNKKYDELKTELEKKIENVLSASLDQFAGKEEFEHSKYELAKHKHAPTGEAMISLEAEGT